MYIQFNDPSSTIAFPCLAQIHSAAYNEEKGALMLYGDFKGQPVTFEIRRTRPGAKHIISILADGMAPNLCNLYSKSIEADPNDPMTILLYSD